MGMYTYGTLLVLSKSTKKKPLSLGAIKRRRKQNSIAKIVVHE